MSNKKKTKILECLFNHFEDGEKRTGYGHTVTELGRSLTNLEIHNRLKINISDIDKLCLVLSNAGHISLLNFDENDKAHRYVITNSGKQAFIDKYYEKQERDFLWSRGKDILTILLALGSLIMSIYNYQNQKSNKKEINDLRVIINKMSNDK